jgi:hypothetical protein
MKNYFSYFRNRGVTLLAIASMIAAIPLSAEECALAEQTNSSTNTNVKAESKPLTYDVYGNVCTNECCGPVPVCAGPNHYQSHRNLGDIWDDYPIIQGPCLILFAPIVSLGVISGLLALGGSGGAWYEDAAAFAIWTPVLSIGCVGVGLCKILTFGMFPKL